MGEHKIRNMEEFAALSGLSRPTVSKSFNDPASAFQGPANGSRRRSLTTAAHDYESVAAKCMETLFSRIEAGGRFATRTETLIPGKLILRASA